MIAFMVKLNGELQMEVFHTFKEADNRWSNVDGGWEIVLVEIKELGVRLP